MKIRGFLSGVVAAYLVPFAAFILIRTVVALDQKRLKGVEVDEW